MSVEAAGVLQQGLRKYLPVEALRRLAEARVGIAGAGGLGSNLAVLLVRSGIRRLVLVDYDRVEPSNLNRQFFFPEDVGRLKVEALKEHLLRLEPEADITTVTARVTSETARRIFDGCDVVAEALDKAEEKAALCLCLATYGFFVVAASGIGGCGLPPLSIRRLGSTLVCVGDERSEAGERFPPLAPRVAQAAALQADVIIFRLLGAVL